MLFAFFITNVCLFEILNIGLIIYRKVIIIDYYAAEIALWCGIENNLRKYNSKKNKINYKHY